MNRQQQLQQQQQQLQQHQQLQQQQLQQQQFQFQQQQNLQSQNTHQQAQRLYNLNAQGSSSSPAPQQSPYASLGIAPDGSQLHQSPNHTISMGNQSSSGPFAYNPSMGPPQQQQQMFQQQMHTSPGATPTPTLGKRKTPGGDVNGREASVLSVPGGGGGGDTNVSAAPGKEGKPAKQPRKKKEKEEKPPKEAKVSKAQQRQAERDQQQRESQVRESQVRESQMREMARATQAAQMGQAGQMAQGGQMAQAGQNSTMAQVGQNQSGPQVGNVNGSAPAMPQPPLQPDTAPAANTNSGQMSMAMMTALQQQSKSFPFDPRLSFYVRTIMQNPAAYNTLIARDPSLEEHLKRALNMVKTGQVSGEMLNSMLKFMATMAHIQQTRAAQHQQRQVQQQSVQPSTPQAERVEQTIPPQPVPPISANVGENERRPPSAHAASVPPPLDTSLPAADGRPFTAGSATSQATPGLSRPAVAPPPMEEWQRCLPTLARLTSIAPLPREIDERADPTFGGALPELTEAELHQYRTWLDKDIEYTRTLEAHSARMAQMTGEWLEKGVRPAWWQMDLRGERPPLVERMSIVWPIEKAAARKHKRPQKGKVAKAMAEY
jgi:hypothetical protein